MNEQKETFFIGVFLGLSEGVRARMARSVSGIGGISVLDWARYPHLYPQKGVDSIVQVRHRQT